MKLEGRKMPTLFQSNLHKIEILRPWICESSLGVLITSTEHKAAGEMMQGLISRLSKQNYF